MKADTAQAARPIVLAIICALAADVPDVRAEHVVGQVSRAEGSAVIQTPGGPVDDLGEGAPIVHDALISTGGDSRLEIFFEDGSVMTLGENARIRIDELIYDPNRGVQAIDVLEGAFRMVRAPGE